MFQKIIHSFSISFFKEAKWKHAWHYIVFYDTEESISWRFLKLLSILHGPEG